MVNLAVLELALALLATEKLIAPFPIPFCPDVIVAQPALLAAIHAHPVWVVTLMLPVPPAAANV
jgi:hypothetical protein